jgi:tellurite resistance protein
MMDPATRRNFATLVAAAFADGLLTQDERLVLHRKATEMGVPIRDMNEMIAQGEQGRLSIGIPDSDREREEMLEALIDVVCADGRVEPPEHHLLAKYASHLKLGLPDLRQKVRNRMEQRATRVTKAAPRTPPQAPPFSPSPSPVPGAAPRTPPQAPPFSPSPSPVPGTAPPPPTLESAPSSPLSPPGPIRLDPPKLVEPVIADLPPVTLHLVKQAVIFEGEEEARRRIEQMLGITREESERILRAVLAAFPGLGPKPLPPPTRPRR